MRKYRTTKNYYGKRNKFKGKDTRGRRESQRNRMDVYGVRMVKETSLSGKIRIRIDKDGWAKKCVLDKEVREAVLRFLKRFPKSDGVKYLSGEQIHFAIKEDFGEKLT